MFNRCIVSRHLSLSHIVNILLVIVALSVECVKFLSTPQILDQGPIFYVMVLISSLHSSFSWLCRLVTGHSKEISNGCVIAFRYSIFSFIPYLVVMHTNEYTLYHIQKQSIHLTSFIIYSDSIYGKGIKIIIKNTQIDVGYGISVLSLIYGNYCGLVTNDCI